jgi:hypothetical protein
VIEVAELVTRLKLEGATEHDAQLARSGQAVDDMAQKSTAAGQRSAGFFSHMKQNASDLLSPLTQASGGFGSMLQSILPLGPAGLGVAAGLGAVTLALGAGVQAWSDWDAGVDAFLAKTGASDAVLDQVGASIINLKSSTAGLGQSMGSIGSVMAEIAQRTGASGTQLEAFSSKVLKMSKLTGEDAVRSVRTLSQQMQSWGVPLNQSGALMDKMFTASQKFGIGVTDLSSKLVQFGAPLRAMGFSMEQSINLFGQFERAGVPAERVMAGLSKAAVELAKNEIPLNEGLRQYVAQIKNASSATEALEIGAGLFGSRGATQMVQAIREGKIALEDLTGALGDTEGAIDRTHERTLDFGDRLEVMWSGFLTSLIPIGQGLMELGEVILPILGAAFTVLGTVVGTVFGAAKAVIEPVINLVRGFTDALGTVWNWISGPFQSKVESLPADIQGASTDAGNRIAEDITQGMTDNVDVAGFKRQVEQQVGGIKPDDIPVGMEIDTPPSLDAMVQTEVEKVKPPEVKVKLKMEPGVSLGSGFELTDEQAEQYRNDLTKTIFPTGKTIEVPWDLKKGTPPTAIPTVQAAIDDISNQVTFPLPKFTVKKNDEWKANFPWEAMMPDQPVALNVPFELDGSTHASLMELARSARGEFVAKLEEDLITKIMLNPNVPPDVQYKVGELITKARDGVKVDWEKELPVALNIKLQEGVFTKFADEVKRGWELAAPDGNFIGPQRPLTVDPAFNLAPESITRLGTLAQQARDKYVSDFEDELDAQILLNPNVPSEVKERVSSLIYQWRQGVKVDWEKELPVLLNVKPSIPEGVFTQFKEQMRRLWEAAQPDPGTIGPPGAGPAGFGGPLGGAGSPAGMSAWLMAKEEAEKSKNTIATLAAGAVKAVGDMAAGVRANFVSAFQSVQANTAAIRAVMVAAFAPAMWRTWGLVAMVALASGILGGGGTARAAAASTGVGVRVTVQASMPAAAFVAAGQNVGNGLTTGILISGQRAIAAARSVAAQVAAAARSQLGIASDSKVFIQIGDFTMSGWATGIKQKGSLPVSAMEMTANEVIAMAKRTVTKGVPELVKSFGEILQVAENAMGVITGLGSKDFAVPGAALIKSFFGAVDTIVVETDRLINRNKARFTEARAKIAGFASEIIETFGGLVDTVKSLGDKDFRTPVRDTVYKYFAAVEYFTELTGRLLARHNALFTETRAQLAEFAGRIVGAFSDSVGVISELGEADFRTPATTAIDNYFGALTYFVERAGQEIERWRARWSEAEAKVAGYVGGAVAGLGSAIDPLGKLGDEEYRPATSLALTRFFDSLDEFTEMAQDRISLWWARWQEPASKVASYVGQSVAGLLAGVEPLGKLADNEDRLPSTLGLLRYFETLDRFTEMAADRISVWWARWKEAEAKVASYVGQAITGLLGSVDPIRKLADEDFSVPTDRAWASYFGALDRFTEGAQDRISLWWARWQEANAKVAKAVGDSVGSLLGTVEPIRKLASGDFSMPTDEAWDRFFGSLDRFIERGKDRISEWWARWKEAEATVAKHVGDAVKNLGATLDPILKLGDAAKVPSAATVDLFWDALDRFWIRFKARQEEWINHTGLVSSATAKVIGDAVSSITGAVGGLQKLADPKLALPADEVIDFFFDRLDYFIRAFAARAAGWKALANEESARLADYVGGVSENISKALDPILKMKDAQAITEGQIEGALANVWLSLHHFSRVMKGGSEGEAFSGGWVERAKTFAADMAIVFNSLGTAFTALKGANEAAQGTGGGDAVGGIFAAIKRELDPGVSGSLAQVWAARLTWGTEGSFGDYWTKTFRGSGHDGIGAWMSNFWWPTTKTEFSLGFASFLPHFDTFHTDATTKWQTTMNALVEATRKAVAEINDHFDDLKVPGSDGPSQKSTGAGRDPWQWTPRTGSDLDSPSSKGGNTYINNPVYIDGQRIEDPDLHRLLVKTRQHTNRRRGGLAAGKVRGS